MKPLIKLAACTLAVLCLIGQVAIVTAAGLQGVDVPDIPEWEVKNNSDGGTLLFSDSPEMVLSNGILYEDHVQGDARLFFYHVNGLPTAQKLDVILENTNHDAAHVTVNNAAMGGPGYFWMAVGKEAMTTYLTGGPAYQLDIPAGETLPLSSKISETAVLPNMLINGIFDFTADRPVTVKVIMKPLFDDSAQFARTASILPADQFHLRGTFKGANRQLVSAQAYDPAHDGAVAITLGDNEVDPFLEGTDATDGSKVVNYGNYGVVYRISFPSQSNGKFSCYLAPRGGDFAGAIAITQPVVPWSPLPIPQGTINFGRDIGDSSAFLGSYDGGERLMLTFSPPGASNLPVRIVFLPQ